MTQPIDIQSLRTKLEGSRGREYWRSLEALDRQWEEEAVRFTAADDPNTAAAAASCGR